MSYINAGKLKQDLNLIALKQTTRRPLNTIGWRKVQIKYCPIVRPVNTVYLIM